MSKRGRIIRRAAILRDYVRAHPEMRFVFGDNMIGKGRGGQAAAMRGEPNAIGVPTKWRPDRDAGAYFRDEDWSNPDVRYAIRDAFARIEAALIAGRDVVIPSAGLGVGLAELPSRAPKIHAYIEDRIAVLSRSSAPEE